MCTCEICVLLAALLEPLCMYLVNLSIKDASRPDAEPHIVRTSDLFLPSRFRKANQLPLTVKPQTYQPNTFLKVLFEAVSTSY